MRTRKTMLVVVVLVLLTIPVGAKEMVNMEFKHAPLVDVF